MNSVLRWFPAVMAAALLGLAINRHSAISWLFGALAVALLVKSLADVLDTDRKHARAVGAAYVAIAVAGLILYLIVA